MDKWECESYYIKCALSISLEFFKMLSYVKNWFSRLSLSSSQNVFSWAKKLGEKIQKQVLANFLASKWELS